MLIKKSMLSDPELVQLVRVRSRAGMGLIYDEYSSVLFLAIFRFVPVQTEAEDILEQTYLQVYSSIDSFPVKNETFFTWMICIARHLAKEYIMNKQILIPA